MQTPKDMILNQATRAFVVSLTDRISDSLKGQKELRDEEQMQTNKSCCLHNLIHTWSSGKSNFHEWPPQLLQAFSAQAQHPTICRKCEKFIEL